MNDYSRQCLWGYTKSLQVDMLATLLSDQASSDRHVCGREQEILYTCWPCTLTHTHTWWYSSADFLLTSTILSAVPSCDSCVERRCYRMMGNASMVFSLEQILYVEDKNLLSGHVLVLLGHDYDAAQASALLH